MYRNRKLIGGGLRLEVGVNWGRNGESLLMGVGVLLGVMK